MVMTKGTNRRWEEVEKDSIELSALARHFELYNRTEGKSPKTIDWYNQALTLFHRFLIESEKSTPTLAIFMNQRSENSFSIFRIEEDGVTIHTW